MESQQTLQDIVSRWEAITVWLTVLSAIVAALASVLAFLAKRMKRPKFDGISLTFGILAAIGTLAASLSLARFAILNRRLQGFQDAARMQLLRDVQSLGDKATNALLTATRAENNLADAKKDLASADQELASAKIRLASVESDQTPRTVSGKQITEFHELLSPFKGQKVTVLAALGEEPLAFSRQMVAVLRDSGWQVTGPLAGLVDQNAVGTSVHISSFHFGKPLSGAGIAAHALSDLLSKNNLGERMRRKVGAFPVGVVVEDSIAPDDIVLMIGTRKNLQMEPGQ
jgi:uncharacterized membrane protein (DUF485 family)